MNPLAKDIIENYLKVDDFIEEHKKKIDERIEHYNEKADCYNDSGATVFIATVLPLASGIVQTGSELKNYKIAKNKILETLAGKEERFVDADAPSVLSALTLMYVVEKRFEEIKQQVNEGKEEQAKLDLWKRILKRTQQGLGEG